MPAAGVIAPGSTARFLFTFQPLEARVYSAALPLRLRPNAVPVASHTQVQHRVPGASVRAAQSRVRRFITPMVRSV